MLEEDPDEMKNTDELNRPMKRDESTSQESVFDIQEEDTLDQEPVFDTQTEEEVEENLRPEDYQEAVPVNKESLQEDELNRADDLKKEELFEPIDPKDLGF